MSCGGFTCSKNALISLNIMYIIVSFILISVAAYGQTSNLVASVKIIGGITACGIFLLLVAILGVLGAMRHHQYMVLLFLIFVVQFSIACACLAMDKDQQETITRTGWRNANDKLKERVQNYYDCCSYNYEWRNETNVSTPISHPSCSKIVQCCPNPDDPKCCTTNIPGALGCFCLPCEDYLRDAVESGLEGSGGIGLFFSFTEFIGVWLTVRYRNQKDPRANPRDFI